MNNDLSYTDYFKLHRKHKLQNPIAKHELLHLVHDITGILQLPVQIVKEGGPIVQRSIEQEHMLQNMQALQHINDFFQRKRLTYEDVLKIIEQGSLDDYKLNKQDD